MIREIFKQRLAALNDRQESKITALVEEYRADLAEVQNTALRFAQSEGEQAVNALSVVAQLGETASATLGAAIKAQKPTPETSLLFDLTDGFATAEAVVLTRLKAMLRDKRMIPRPPDMDMMEEVGPPYRVCDEAYVNLRRILKLESYTQYLQESQYFLSLPEAAKDKEIQSWSSTGKFARLLNDLEPEEK